MRPTELIISLDRVEQNFRVLRSHIPSSVKTLAVVKADAYGHGLVPVAHRLAQAGADMFAVAILEEAIQLRESGIACPILVLGGIRPRDTEEAVKWDVSLAVYTEEVLLNLADAARRLEKPATAHLKVDTGMSRVGVRPGEDLENLLKVWKTCPEVEMTGMFTHFAAAGSDPQFTEHQHNTFMSAIETVRSFGYAPVTHEAATEACLKPKYQLDMVRLGIGLYGYLVDELKGELGMAQKLVSRPLRIETILPGETVSYGRTFVAERPTRVMTVPIGYGDGFPRLLSSRAEALVRGRRVPVIGRICMDMLMLDVTDVPDVSLKDEIVLMGSQGGECITAEELARHAETIPYEIMLGFTGRVRRIIRS